MVILDSWNSTFYPNINHLLRVGIGNPPVFTTEVERSFSTLKSVKTLLRNQIGNNRLTGLFFWLNFKLPICESGHKKNVICIFFRILSIFF